MQRRRRQRLMWHSLSKEGGSHQRLEKQQILPESLWRECSPDNSLILDFHPPTPKEQISIFLSHNTWCKLLWKHQKTNTRVFGSWLCMDSTSLWWKRLTCSPLLIPFEGNLVFCVSIYLRYLHSFTGLTRSFRWLPSLCPKQRFTLVHWLVAHVSSTSFPTPFPFVSSSLTVQQFPRN